MTIQEAIKRLADRQAETYSKICTVDAVDETARTVDVTPIDEGAPILGANLQANQEGGNGLVCYPAVGSHVVVSFVNDAAGVVVLTEIIDKIQLVAGDDKPVSIAITNNTLNVSVNGTSIEISGDKTITFNGGDNGGLVISQNTADKLAAIETDLNSLKTAVSGWAPVAQDGGAALKGLISGWAGQSFTPTQKNDLENNNIKH